MSKRRVFRVYFRYLGCAENRRMGCRARAIIPANGGVADLHVSRQHNHPPDANIEEKEAFLKHLKTAVNTFPGALKKIYDTVAAMYYA